MRNNPTLPTQVPGAAVGSLPDRMAAAIQVGVLDGTLHQHYGKQEAAHHLYANGYTMSDIVEYLDDAIAKERGVEVAA